MSKATLLDRVCIVYRGNANSADINTLVYRPEGFVRTYRPDEIDDRVGTVDVVTDPAEITRRLCEGIGSAHSFAVPVRVARQVFGWKLDEFYDPDR